MNGKSKLLLICIGVISCLSEHAFAQTIIECNVNYIYQDKTRAVREQQWEEGWHWNIKGPSGVSFTLAKNAPTYAKFETKNTLLQGTYSIVFTNNRDQMHEASLTISDSSQGNKHTLNIIKIYNKIILKNRNNQIVTGVVYFARSGITDFADLTNPNIGIKCPPASNKGYSFPSIKEKGKADYSIYIPDSEKGFLELSFSSNNWYGISIIKDIQLN